MLKYISHSRKCTENTNTIMDINMCSNFDKIVAGLDLSLNIVCYIQALSVSILKISRSIC